MVHPVQVGKRTRMSFAKVKDVTEMPNLIEVQLDSYEWFLREGLLEVFDDVNPISNFTGNLVLEFVDYKLDMDNIKYSVEECKERDCTYAAPLKVSVRLTNNETGEIKEQEVFMGDFPLMTEQGTFIINGAERVIVSQLVRSPGVYYSNTVDKSGKKLFSSTVIPNRGAWLEYETDSNDVIYVRIDKTIKLPISILARAMGYGSDQELLDYFGEEERFKACHHPFTSPMDEDLDMIETNPGAVRSKAYDLVLNGEELGGGSIRIHDSELQTRMFKALGFTEESAYERFGFLIDAFKFGPPPHGGLAFGLDRMIMFLAGTENIKDVIAFPKNQNAYCYLSEAPNVVDQKQIDELGLIIKSTDKE